MSYRCSICGTSKPRLSSYSPNERNHINAHMTVDKDPDWELGTDYLCKAGECDDCEHGQVHSIREGCRYRQCPHGPIRQYSGIGCVRYDASRTLGGYL